MSDQKEETFGKGQVLFRQGEKSRDLYFVKAGEIELSVYNEETGATSIVATVGERSVLGSMSFLEGEPRSATATAKTEVKAVRVNDAQRDKLLKTVPSWLQVLVKDLSASLRRLNAKYAALASENTVLKKRVAHLKAKLGDETAEDGGPPDKG